MGILVDKNSTFEVSFYYNLINNEDDQTIGVEILEEEQKGCLEFKSLWVPATHEEMTFIREESSVINHINEKAILLLKEFRPRLICSFCREWNLTDNDGYPLPITREVVANMFENFVIKIIEEWKNAIGSKEPIHQNFSWEHITKELVRDILLQFMETLPQGE